MYKENEVANHFLYLLINSTIVDAMEKDNLPTNQSGQIAPNQGQRSKIREGLGSEINYKENANFPSSISRPMHDTIFKCQIEIVFHFYKYNIRNS